MKLNKNFKKISKYVIYYFYMSVLLIGYWGFVTMYYNQFPIYNNNILDWISALGLYILLYNYISKCLNDLLILLNLKQK